MITRCTDCVRHFIMPYDYEEIEEVSVTFSQNGRPIVTKENDDLEFDQATKTLTAHLLPGDTACFGCGATDSKTVYIQLLVKLTSGKTYGSNVFKERLEDNLKGGLL